MGVNHRTGSIDAHIGAQLRKLRLEHNLSQAVVGEIIGVTFQQLQKYENASNRISAASLFQLAQAFDVSVTYTKLR